MNIRIIFIILFLLLLNSCAKVDRTIAKDLTGINEQLYDLQQKEIKNKKIIFELQKKVKENNIIIEKMNQKEVLPPFEQRYKVAYSQYIKGDYTLALKKFKELNKDITINKLEDNALYWQAMSLLKLNQKDDAILILQKIIVNYPFGDKAQEALYELSNINFKEKNYTQAYYGYMRLIDLYPKTQHKKEVLDKLKIIKKQIRRKK